jgi:hypothetical protein
MADFEEDDAAAFRGTGLQRSPPQEHSLTPGRSELIRLARAMANWEQDPIGIFRDEQCAGNSPAMSEEASDLLLSLATEAQKVATGSSAADVKNVVLDQLAKLREEVALRKQEEGAGGAGGGSRPGDVQVVAPAWSRQTRQSGSLQKQLKDARLDLYSTRQHANLADEQNLAACKAALQRLLAAWTNLRGVLKGVHEAERFSQK